LGRGREGLPCFDEEGAYAAYTSVKLKELIETQVVVWEGGLTLLECGAGRTLLSRPV